MVTIQRTVKQGSSALLKYAAGTPSPKHALELHCVQRCGCPHAAACKDRSGEDWARTFEDRRAR